MVEYQKTEEVRKLLNIKYSHTPLTQSTVSETETKFIETGYVKQVPNSPTINDNVKLDVLSVYQRILTLNLNP